jgi:hypothetical protein
LYRSIGHHKSNGVRERGREREREREKEREKKERRDIELES